MAAVFLASVVAIIASLATSSGNQCREFLYENWAAGTHDSPEKVIDSAFPGQREALRRTQVNESLVLFEKRGVIYSVGKAPYGGWALDRVQEGEACRPTYPSSVGNGS